MKQGASRRVRKTRVSWHNPECRTLDPRPPGGVLYNLTVVVYFLHKELHIHKNLTFTARECI